MKEPVLEPRQSESPCREPGFDDDSQEGEGCCLPSGVTLRVYKAVYTYFI